MNETAAAPLEATEEVIAEEVAAAGVSAGAVWWWRRGEAWLFWIVAAAHLLPIWSFPYFPTQDGPAHLNGALILKDFGKPGTRYHEYFELRFEATPNWTAHALLAGFMFLVPPLVAEKILLSIYVLGFAAALRYFCGAFGERTRPLAIVGLLFVYNRCLWLGFYSFGLSLALCFFVLGYWLRRRAQADLATAGVLTLLLVAVYLSHLVGFFAAAAGLLWLALTAPRRRWRNLGLVTAACLPAALFAMDYFDRTGFFSPGGAQRLRDHAGQWLRGQGSWAWLGNDLAALDDEYFTHHVGGAAPMGLIAAALYAALTTATCIACWFPARGQADLPGGSSLLSNPSPARWPIAVLAIGFAAVYVLLPLHLSMEHGGFLKGRIALLPPLLVLACFREMPMLPMRLLLRVLIVLILAMNLFFVMRRVAADNQELAEYTAGLDVVGAGKTLFVMQEPQRPGRGGGRDLADPLLHASQHYCLGTGNLNLDNYQATTRHFPLHFRDGIPRGRGTFAWYERQQDVDVILAWEAGPNLGVPRGFRSVFQQGRLEVFVRVAN